MIKANKELVESNKELANQVEMFFEEKKAFEETKTDNLKKNGGNFKEERVHKTISI